MSGSDNSKDRPMSAFHRNLIAFSLLSVCSLLVCDTADAGYRQRYSSWSYSPARRYYYTTYYYQPHSNYDGYLYHYCIYYPSQPRYVYYYNPHSGTYWGRYDMDEEGYSMLAEKDRKGTLVEIPDSAFPKPGKMPAVPESKDNVSMVTLKKQELPKEESAATSPDQKEAADLPPAEKEKK